MNMLEKFRLENEILQKMYDVYDNIEKYLVEGENKYRIICYILDQDRVIHHYMSNLITIQEGLGSDLLKLEKSIIYNHFAELVDIADDMYKMKAEVTSWHKLVKNVSLITNKTLVVSICVDNDTSTSTGPSEESCSSKSSIL